MGVTGAIGRLAGAPADLLSTLRLLPSIAENTAAMAEATAVLPRVLEALQTLERMDGRMGNIEAAMPVLVEVQGHLARVPDTLQTLDAGITRLSTVLDQLLEELAALDAQMGKLQESIDPLARIVQRLPGGGQRD